VTRWGVLADIHGNLRALEMALACLRERNVDRIAVLGDNLGRGDSDGCVELIRTVADVSVVGNRDLDWKDRVGAAAADYVRGLPRIAQIDDLVFSHGDARLTRELSSDDIRADFRRARTWLAANGCQTWLFGHTHRARVWAIGKPDATPRLLFDAATDPVPAVIHVGDEATNGAAIRIVNAGSVGLPFPGKGPASVTVYNTTAGVVEIFPL
jgi:predicted phosphodiesterase